MEKLSTIIKKSILLCVVLTFCISCSHKEEKFPTSLINKRLYMLPYFVCRDNLIVDKDYNFTLTTYSIGTLNSADKYVIKGKFIEGNKVVYNSSNQADGYTFLENVEFYENPSGPQNNKYPIVRFNFNYWNVTRGQNDIGIMDFSISKNGGCEPGY
jgi:hypothetical protein